MSKCLYDHNEQHSKVFESGFISSVLLNQVFLIFLCSSWVCWPLKHMVRKPSDRCQALLKKYINTQQIEAWCAPQFGLDKHSRPSSTTNISKWHDAPKSSQTLGTSHWTSNILDSLPSSGPWFLTEMQIYLHLKTGLWTTEQPPSFWSLAQVILYASETFRNDSIFGLQAQRHLSIVALNKFIFVR